MILNQPARVVSTNFRSSCVKRRDVVWSAINNATVLQQRPTAAVSGVHCTTSGRNAASLSSFDEERRRPSYSSHLPTSPLQKMILFAGSAVVGLTDPWRSDMVAVNGEVSGAPALSYMHSRMKNSSEGRLVLEERPRISTMTVDYDALSTLPDNTLGKVVADFNAKHNISPDSRAKVQFVQDPELAYVMQRYREVHDLLHALLDVPTDMVGEVTVKWIEALQFGLPMCAGGAVLGPARFKKPSQFKRYEKYRPWAIKVGTKSRFLLNVYYEMRWEQDIQDLRREMRIDKPPTLAEH